MALAAAAYSVVQQRFLLDSGLLLPGVPHTEVLLGTLRLLAYSNAYQPLWLMLLAWVDALPWFGFSVAGMSELPPVRPSTGKSNSNLSTQVRSTIFLTTTVFRTGDSHNSWAANTGRSLACSFGGGCRSDLPNFSVDVPVPLFSFAYVLGYVAYYAGLGKCCVHV